MSAVIPLEGEVTRMRSRLRRVAASGPPSRDLGDISAPAMARPFMLMFAAAGTLTAAHLALPASGQAHDVLLAVASGVCFALAALIAVTWRRIPEWAYQLFLTAASFLTAFVIYASGDSASAYAMFFFWIATGAFYFFGEAAEQGVLIAIAVGLAVGSDPGDLTSLAVVNWIFFTVVLSVAGALIGRMGRERMTQLEDRVVQAARTDQTTGLLNRRGFEEAMRAEFERAQRTNRSFSVLVADIDGFRRINDGFGAHAGDLAFEYIGAIIRRAKRRIDLAARIGEDEFALLLPETGEHAAYVVAERIRHELRTSFASEPVPLTISMGVVNWPLHEATARGLITAGEHALMLAKELGGDRSAMYGENILTRLATASARKDEDKHLVTLMSLAEAVDIRDGGTAAHCQNVGRYAAALARELGLTAEMIDRVRCAGVLHDLGKIGVPDSILQKPGPLDEREWIEMRKHPELGAHILEGTDLSDVRQWVLAHHERPDGRGYPYGLEPQQVPLEAKIVAVADAFEAMTADRRPRIPARDAGRRRLPATSGRGGHAMGSRSSRGDGAPGRPARAVGCDVAVGVRGDVAVCRDLWPGRPGRRAMARRGGAAAERRGHDRLAGPGLDRRPRAPGRTACGGDLDGRPRKRGSAGRDDGRAADRGAQARLGRPVELPAADGLGRGAGHARRRGRPAARRAGRRRCVGSRSSLPSAPSAARIRRVPVR